MADTIRQIVLDTETTGLDPKDGHRVIEIGCVELIDRRLTGNNYHVYLCPDRKIDAEAEAVHGLSSEFLASQPRFAEVAADFLDYVRDDELVIHNAPFDIGFLNHELALLKPSQTPLDQRCPVFDTLPFAKRMFPGSRVSLDALCRRLAVDNSHRELHGALLDAEILADVFLLMTGGQNSLLLEPEAETKIESSSAGNSQLRQSVNIPVIQPSDADLQAHNQMLEVLRKAAGGSALWDAL